MLTIKGKIDTCLNLMFWIFVLCVSIPSNLNGQNKIRQRKLYVEPNSIDTILVFNPRTYISIKNGQSNYLYSPELSEIVCDSIYEATERYFADTVIHFSNKKTKKPIEPGYMYLDSVQNNQLYDSINNYLSILKQKSGKVETTVPDYFMQFLKDQNHRFGLLIFQYGFIKSDDFYKRQIAGTIIAALIARGNWFDLSEFHSELSCAIIDKQTSSLVYFGSVSSSKLPLSVAAQQDHFHWLFDRSLGIRSKKN